MTMNRMLLESLSYKENTTQRHFQDFCLRNPEFMSTEPLAPEFVLHEKLEFDESPLASEESLDISQSLNENLTFCSNYSGVESFRALYREVFQKRNVHSPFQEIEKEADELYHWYYLENKSGKELGPFDSAAMDQRLRWGILGEKSKVRLEFSAEFNYLSLYIKQYVTRIAADKGREDKGSRKASATAFMFSKDIQFHRQESRREVPEGRNREDRVWSNIVRPNIALISACLSSQLQETEDDDEEEVYERSARNRASTFTPLVQAFQ
jgi:hypothetical protein